jgi:hypothetical protein
MGQGLVAMSACACARPRSTGCASAESWPTFVEALVAFVARPQGRQRCATLSERAGGQTVYEGLVPSDHEGGLSVTVHLLTMAQVRIDNSHQVPPCDGQALR